MPLLKFSVYDVYKRENAMMNWNEMAGNQTSGYGMLGAVKIVDNELSRRHKCGDEMSKRCIQWEVFNEDDMLDHVCGKIVQSGVECEQGL